MSEAIILALILLLVIGGMLAFFHHLSKEAQRRAAQTEEEWENRSNSRFRNLGVRCIVCGCHITISFYKRKSPSIT